jgi:Mn2+/Fe2+ NRAMP family transporter
VRAHGRGHRQGLSDLIREEFGLRMTFLMMLLLVVVNFGNVIAEFSGIAGSMQLFHISKYISVPLCALAVWALVVKGNYKSVEKVFLAASVFYIAYIIAGVMSGPDWHTALTQTVKLPERSIWSDHNYVYMTVGVIGTTITPWMQFYLQSSIVDKGVTVGSTRLRGWMLSSAHSSPTSLPGSSLWSARRPSTRMACATSTIQPMLPRR